MSKRIALITIVSMMIIIGGCGGRIAKDTVYPVTIE